jgi:hypothetical protein
MAGVYSVEGKLGTGKTKFAVWRAKLALLEGRRVAGNVDLFLEHLVPGLDATYTRLPDKPTAFDLDALGPGATGKYDEDQFGVLLLDELGTWLNSRSFQDKTRAQVLDWLIHARKHRWEVYLIVQDANMIDRQVREALIEYQCKCLRMDKVMIPLVGKLIRDIAIIIWGHKAKKAGALPRFHLVTSRLGNETKVVAERWMYRGDDLHEGYNTEQVFTPDYPHGVHCVLPPWERVKSLGLLARLRKLIAPKPRPHPSPRPKLRVVELLQALPPDERMKHTQRLVRLGVL